MMVACEIVTDANDRLCLQGELAFATVMGLLDQSKPLFRERESLVFDLGGVDKTDSAGLALLVEWMGWAEKDQKSIQFVNIPRQMMDIARVSGLDRVLPVSMTAPS